MSRTSGTSRRGRADRTGADGRAAGCGKSTILNSVAGLLKPSSGDVAIDGRTVSGVQESVGYLFQQDALLPWKTAFQNVELGLRFRGVPEAERKAKANAWLAKVGLARQIASAVNLIVQVERMRDGGRRIVSITEVCGMENDVIQTQELYGFTTTSVDADGRLVGQFGGSGQRPQFYTQHAHLFGGGL